MKLRAKSLCLGMVMLTGALAFPGAQAQTEDPTVIAANTAYTAHDWPRAEELYGGLAKADPENGRWWYRLGTAQRGNHHYEAGLASFVKAKALGAGKGLPNNLADYEIACTLAGAGDRARALENLKAAADGGFYQTDRMEKDAEWRELRDDAQFLALSREVHHNAAPCEDGEFRQFDFWVGDWDVVSTADGIKHGSSHVSKEMGDCVIWENWTSAAGGYFGKSYNTYNVNLHRWEQYWVDNGAGTIFFHGGLKEGVMDYWTDNVPQPKGGMLQRHLQFFNQGPNRVRQFSQASKDGGKTWTVEYDLTYNRHEAGKDAGSR
jgi:hypothetical protein